jgi:hypothetical protein
MEMFIKYMDQIKAEDALKEKAKQFVAAAAGLPEVAGTCPDAAKHQTPKTRVFRGFREMIAAAAVLAAVIIGGLAYYQMPVNYVSLDINPSLELGVNAFDRVVAVEAFNGDGLQLEERQRLKNASLADAVRALVQEAIRQGYIHQDGSSVVSLTSVSKKAAKAALLQERIREAARLALMEADVKAVVYSDGTDMKQRVRAHELGLSAGKYKLIQLLQELAPELDLEDLRDANITALILKADALMPASGFEDGQAAELQQAFRMIAAAALEIHANEQLMLQSRNMAQSQADGTADLQQNREQLRNQSQKPIETQQEQNGTDSQTQNQAQSPLDGQTMQIADPASDAGQGQSTGQESAVQDQEKTSAQESGQNQPDQTEAPLPEPDRDAGQPQNDGMQVSPGQGNH